VADGDSPVLQRRRVAKELRQLRLDRGKTVGEVAAAMECSPGKISRIETAVVGARVGDVRDLLDLYEVPAGPDRDRILDLVRQSRRRTSWWHEYAGLLPPESMRFFGLEDGAAGVDEYSGNLIPGLVQSDGYGRALIETARDGFTTTTDEKDTADLRVELRTARRRLLTRDDAPMFRFVVNEAALAVRFGGPEVMVDQLDLLARVSDRPNVTVRVLPMDAGAYAAAGSSFRIFKFADPEADPPIVFIENRTFSTYREAPAEVEVYTRDFAELLDTALPARRSRQVIRHWATVHREAAQPG
jgi:transcriptional regulator with XRE-family HTH domain